MDSCIREIVSLDTAGETTKNPTFLPIQEKVLRSDDRPTALFVAVPVSCRFCSGCTFVATKVTAEVDVSPVVIGSMPLKAMVFVHRLCSSGCAIDLPIR
ncbi:hypothetical protein [Synechococcus sp. CC9311]|uniref:hypothetical protein n=1 Tax=Synechococcus sp. (strain CC9311) TaxID=64471 RepID=UPI00059D08D4|nr:hypothetical protein [Synechococcus sp. CC9311]